MTAYIVVITIGIVIMLPGLRWLSLLVLFYMGRNRELYFHPTRSWMVMGPRSWLSIIPGCAWTSLIFGDLTVLTLFLIVLLLSPFVLIIISVILRLFPPRWLADFHSQHSREERNVVREQGRSMLAKRPRIFRQIIRSRDGWESWLLTIT